MDKISNSQVGISAWTLVITLDGAPLPADVSIGDSQQARAGYVADAVEQALLLPEGHGQPKVDEEARGLPQFKERLSPSKFTNYSPSLTFFFLILILIFVFPNLHISSSLKGCPIPAYGRGDSEQLLSNDEGRGGQTHCCHGGFQGGREESLRTDH